MAHKKAAGTAKNGRDSWSKRRGVKIFGGEVCVAGNILVRQKGALYLPEQGVAAGKDFTLYALRDGKVAYGEKRVRRYDGRIYRRTTVAVV